VQNRADDVPHAALEAERRYLNVPLFRAVARSSEGHVCGHRRLSPACWSSSAAKPCIEMTGVGKGLFTSFRMMLFVPIKDSRSAPCACLAISEQCLPSWFPFASALAIGGNSSSAAFAGHSISAQGKQSAESVSRRENDCEHQIPPADQSPAFPDQNPCFPKAEFAEFSKPSVPSSYRASPVVFSCKLLERDLQLAGPSPRCQRFDVSHIRLHSRE